MKPHEKWDRGTEGYKSFKWGIGDPTIEDLIYVSKLGYGWHIHGGLYVCKEKPVTGGYQPISDFIAKLRGGDD